MHTLNGTLLSLFKETQPCATTWVKLEGILLGETSQSQKVAWGLPGQLGQEESVEGCRAPVFQNEGILKICNPSSSVNRLCTTDCTFKMVKVANYMLRAVFRQLKKGFRPTMGFWTRSIKSGFPSVKWTLSVPIKCSVKSSFYSYNWHQGCLTFGFFWKHCCPSPCGQSLMISSLSVLESEVTLALSGFWKAPA